MSSRLRRFALIAPAGAVLAVLLTATAPSAKAQAYLGVQLGPFGIGVGAPAPYYYPPPAYVPYYYPYGYYYPY
jgi:hypothetical protein